MYTPTITKYALQEWDQLLYRGDSFFSFIIKIWEVLRYGKIKHFFTAFTHVAQVVYNRECDCLQRFDAMEGMKTGFREQIWQAYVFRWKKEPTARELMLWREYLMKRRWSVYDRKWAFSTSLQKEVEDVFWDYCSELDMNSWIASWKVRNGRAPTPYQFYLKFRNKMDFIWVII